MIDLGVSKNSLVVVSNIFYLNPLLGEGFQFDYFFFKWVDTTTEIGGTPPKWMLYSGKPFFLMDDLGGKPTIFGHIHVIVTDGRMIFGL